MIVQLLLAASFALPNAEFARYHREMTGREPPSGLVKFAIDPKVSASGKDAYRIVSEGEGVRITGSNERSVWYGLYDLLERRGGCRWFWDGDIVPKREALDLSGLDVKEEARFEYRGIRYFAHRGLTRFQAEHWGYDDWKKEIDWCLKRRLNLFMLRLGQDDLFQRAFPETVSYPDPAKDLPGHGKGYDDRTLFWSLQYRGQLRADVQAYGRARGLMIPEDFGTMTHWYSRTPEEYLEKKNPPFLPQATTGYSEKNGLVWDIRDAKWIDEYWKLTEAAVQAYGGGTNELLHTIGLGERRCFKDRKDNFALKTYALDKFLARAHAAYPNSKVLIAGWDLYFSWHPEEVQALVRKLDPKRDIIWDYEGDATRDYQEEMKDVGGNSFLKWDVVGKFPYTYSIFLAYENALDIRANYPLIEERQKVVQDDPMCAGYLLWPESSHTDTLLIRYFTANAWSKTAVTSGQVLDELCASRYGTQGERLKAVWQKVMPLSRLLDWWNNYGTLLADHGRWQGSDAKTDKYNDPAAWQKEFPKELGCAAEIFRELAALDWKASPFVERDAIDLARTTADRLIIAEHAQLVRAYHAWKAGAGSAETVFERATRLKQHVAAMADLLALHTDYSLAESFDRLDAVEKIRNPNFGRVLVDNATCSYCASHQYESAEYWYKPVIHAFADDLVRRVRANDRTKLGPYKGFDELRQERMFARPLAEMRPALPRTQENYVRTLKRMGEGL